MRRSLSTWFSEGYLNDDSIGKIAVGFKLKGTLSPTASPSGTGMPTKWRKYTGRVPLQKAISTGTIQNKNDDSIDRYLYAGCKGPLFDYDDTTGTT